MARVGFLEAQKEKGRAHWFGVANAIG